MKAVLDKECLCVGLSNAAAINYKETFVKKLPAVNICPGPNIANFSQVVSLQTMTDHIYGRVNLVTNATRPHMFIAELKLYLNYLKSLFQEDLLMGLLSKKQKFYTSFFQSLKEGIQYYQGLRYTAAAFDENFGKALATAAAELDALHTENNKSI